VGEERGKGGGGAHRYKVSGDRPLLERGKKKRVLAAVDEDLPRGRRLGGGGASNRENKPKKSMEHREQIRFWWEEAESQLLSPRGAHRTQKGLGEGNGGGGVSSMFSEEMRVNWGS